MFFLRATLITPPPYGHPLYKQRGSLQGANNQQLVPKRSSKKTDASAPNEIEYKWYKESGCTAVHPLQGLYVAAFSIAAHRLDELVELA